MDDHELLREYFERHSESAFAELVARHLNLVYANARRLVGDPAAAQDVAQLVFIQLARKGWSVRNGQALAGWLYRVTVNTARDWQRSEIARRQRETDAMKLSEIDATVPAGAEHLAGLLDDALRQLSRPEQDAVMLRYFEGKSVRETGAALTVSEEAAQKRLGRAVEKMRIHFARSGVTVASAAIISTMSAHTSQAAPAGMAMRVAEASLAQSGSIGVLAKILFMTAKTKSILAFIVLIALAILLTIILRPLIEGKPVTQVTRENSEIHSTPVLPQSALATTTGATVRSQTVVPTQPPANPVGTASTVSTSAPANPGAVQAAGADAWQHDLKTTIPEAIRLLESKDMLLFVRTLISPNLLNNLPAGMTLEQAVQRSRADPNYEQNNQAMINALHAIENQEPELNAAGDHATYRLYPAIGGHDQVIFVKIDGQWYMDRL